MKKLSSVWLFELFHSNWILNKIFLNQWASSLRQLCLLWRANREWTNFFFYAWWFEIFHLYGSLKFLTRSGITVAFVFWADSECPGVCSDGVVLHAGHVGRSGGTSASSELQPANQRSSGVGQLWPPISTEQYRCHGCFWLYECVMLVYCSSVFNISSYAHQHFLYFEFVYIFLKLVIGCIINLSIINIFSVTVFIVSATMTLSLMPPPS